MRVLVTGHRGYIGSVLTCVLRNQRFEVFGLDSDLFAGCDFGRVSEDVPGYDMDLRDVDFPDLISFDAVVHLAGLSDDACGMLNPDLTQEINVAATERLAWISCCPGSKRYSERSRSLKTSGSAAPRSASRTGTLRVRRRRENSSPLTPAPRTVSPTRQLIMSRSTCSMSVSAARRRADSSSTRRRTDNTSQKKPNSEPINAMINVIAMSTSISVKP